MAFAQRQELKLGQALVMTPQLQQAIKLLQMPNVELAAYIEEQLEKNPLLEEVQEDGAADEWAEREPPADGDAGLTPPSEGVLESDRVIASDDMVGEVEAAFDVDPRQAYAADDTGVGLERAPDFSASPVGAGGAGEQAFDLEAVLSEAETLRDHLTWQLEISGLGPVERAIGALLIGGVDEAGYLAESLSEIAGRAGVDLDTAEAVLSRVQQFEPTGVFSRDLAECLALQLKERDRLDPAMQILLQNLDRLAKRDFSGLSELCGLEAAEVIDMAKEIRELNPKPGLAYARDRVETVIPDVFIWHHLSGWRVELNSDALPKVLVNQRYYTQISGAAKEKEAKTFVDGCYAEANWLVKSLDQRARTILKVVSDIVRQQEAFMLHGVHHLRPLNLKAVADAVGLHESTVSRVTSNKYASTPRGVLELKYFFSSPIPSASGRATHSAEAVRHRIKKMIDGEGPDECLSDDRIVEILRASDIDIARRTVVKYREAMRIPSSVQRRKSKAWSGATA